MASGVTVLSLTTKLCPFYIRFWTRPEPVRPVRQPHGVRDMFQDFRAVAVAGGLCKVVDGTFEVS